MKKNSIYALISISLLITVLSCACICTQCLPDDLDPNGDTLTATRLQESTTTNTATVQESTSTTLGEITDFKTDSTTINFNVLYDFYVPGNTDKIEFVATIPNSYPLRQEIIDYNFSIEPDFIFDSEGNKYIKFIIENPQEDFSINESIEMVLYGYDLGTAKILDSKDHSLSREDYLKYTSSDNFIDSSNSSIKEAASMFANDDMELLVNDIYNFVLEKVQYSGYDPGNACASDILASGGGDCTGYSDLFAALCRAKNIPSRTVEGFTIDANPGDLSTGHNWSEVFFEDYGWVPFDATFDDNNGDSPNTTFDNLKNVYVYTSFLKNDETLLNYHYYCYIYYGDSIQVQKTVSIN